MVNKYSITRLAKALTEDHNKQAKRYNESIEIAKKYYKDYNGDNPYLQQEARLAYAQPMKIYPDSTMWEKELTEYYERKGAEALGYLFEK